MPPQSLKQRAARVALLARFFALAVFAVCAAFALAGCTPRLAGLNDVALEYDADSNAAALDPPLATRVQARLAAGQVTTDVTPAAGGAGVLVVADADEANEVDALVGWRGGLVASVAAVPGGQDGPVLADLPLASVESVRRGRALALTFAPHARDALLAAKAEHAQARVALSRGATRLGTFSFDEALATPLVVSFGDGVTAYTRAAWTRALLESPGLPAMHRASLVRLPPDRALAAGCALLPFALSFAWLAFVRRFDRARPEPTWLVLATFTLGGLAAVPAGLVELGCSAATPWLDPAVMTFGGQAWALPVAFVVFSLVVGLPEEGAKFLGAWSLARRRKEFDEPVDGIVYGCAAALGFAAVENVKYFAVGRMSAAIIAVRAFVTVPTHLFFGAIWGYALGRQLVERSERVWPLFVLAVCAHGAFDALLSIDGMQPASVVIVVALAFGFVAALRSALRYGVVAPRAPAGVSQPLTEPLPPGDLPREYFRVGSRAKFYACTTGLIACAFALTVLGGAYEYVHHRIGAVFVTLATSMLGLFGLMAFGVSETIPLDVAIDAQGVTFGGARTPWKTIVSVEIEPRGARATVRLHTTDAVVRLGPAQQETAHMLAAAIRKRHASFG